MIDSQLEAEITYLRLEQSKLQALLDVSRALNAARNPDDVLKTLIKTAVEAGATGAYLLYIDLNQSGEPEWAEIAASWVRDEEFGVMPSGFRIYLPEFPFNRLWLSNPNDTHLIADIAQSDVIDDNLRSLLESLTTGALVVVPLTQGGRWVGLVSIGWPQPHQFGELETALYQALPVLAAPVVENLRVVANQELVIEQRTAEMRDARNMLQTVLNTIPVRVFWKDTESRFLGGNRLFAQDMGCEAPDELVGKSDYDYAAADRAEDYRADDKAVRDSKQALLNIEEQLTRGDGSIIWLRTSKVPLLDREGRCIGTLGVYDDITLTREAEAERDRLQQQIIEAQKQALAELSTPIIPIMDRIIVMPLVGAIDTGRSRDIMRSLLEGISLYRAQIAILDITGVPVVDSGVADHLNRTMQAARLKGAQTIITGVSDAVAETIVDLGIDWSAFETLRDLQTGLVTALERVGFQLMRYGSPKRSA